MTPIFEIFGQNVSHFSRFEGSFLTIYGVKKSISRLFQSCFGLVWEVFGLCFRPQRAFFWVYFELQRSINNLKNRDLGSKICSFWPI